MCDAELVKELQQHRITLTVKYGRGSVMVCMCHGGGFCHLQSQKFAPGERQIQSDRLSQHTATSCDLIWNAACDTMSRIYAHTCIHTCACAPIHVCMCVYVYTPMHMCVHTHAHLHTHTHTHTHIYM